MSSELTTELSSAMQLYLRDGDLSRLPPQEKTNVLLRMCKHYDLDPVLRPFILIKLNNKEVWYATKAATDQVALKLNLTREIISIKENIDRGILECTVKIIQPNSDRIETCTAAVSIIEYARDKTGAVVAQPIKGEAYANALMKVETKAKRRATLGWLGIADYGVAEDEPVIIEAQSEPKKEIEEKHEDDKPRKRKSRAELESKVFDKQEKVINAEIDESEKEVEKAEEKPNDEKIKTVATDIEIEKKPEATVNDDFIPYDRLSNQHKMLMKNTLAEMGISLEKEEHIQIASRISKACNGTAPCLRKKDGTFAQKEFREFIVNELKKEKE